MAECGIGPVQISGKVSRGTGDYGTTVTADLSKMYFINQRFMTMASVGSTWADADHMKTYFGVSSVQSARSGYRRYEAKSGFKSVGFNIGAFYSVTENIDMMFMVMADQLVGDAADSPLTKTDFQPSTFLTLSYKF
jgi:outer membrane scaffolding protein for murein synthesis (MipA/OmpV family)